MTGLVMLIDDVEDTWNLDIEDNELTEAYDDFVNYHSCGEWNSECTDGFCDYGINPCATHVEDCHPDCQYED